MTPTARSDARQRRDAWIDVPADHDAEASTDRDDFALGVGLEGYERGTGEAVAQRPGLKRPGEKSPSATPFDD